MNLIFRKNWQLFETNQYDEFHPPEETLDYQPTNLSFTRVNK